MKLKRDGRENLRLEIATEPAVTAWEVSFDDGATWKPGTPGIWTTDDGRQINAGEGWLWLIAGPDVELGDAVVQLELGQHEVLVRAVDDPEIIVRDHDTFVVVT